MDSDGDVGEPLPLDYLGQPRLVGPPDMGAFENQTAVSRTIFVDLTATTGANNGTSWTDAFVDVQSALANWFPGDEIWVADGRYTPHASDRTATYALPDGVQMYGGFAGGETDRAAANPELNLTVLSGDLAGDDMGPVSTSEITRSDNSLHVVTASNLTTAPLLDGFIVSDGNADNPNFGSGDTSGARDKDRRFAAASAASNGGQQQCDRRPSRRRWGSSFLVGPAG